MERRAGVASASRRAGMMAGREDILDRADNESAQTSSGSSCQERGFELKNGQNDGFRILFWRADLLWHCRVGLWILRFGSGDLTETLFTRRGRAGRISSGFDATEGDAARRAKTLHLLWSKISTCLQGMNDKMHLRGPWWRGN